MTKKVIRYNKQHANVLLLNGYVTLPPYVSAWVRQFSLIYSRCLEEDCHVVALMNKPFRWFLFHITKKQMHIVEANDSTSSFQGKTLEMFWSVAPVGKHHSTSHSVQLKVPIWIWSVLDSIIKIDVRMHVWKRRPLIGLCLNWKQVWFTLTKIQEAQQISLNRICILK